MIVDFILWTVIPLAILWLAPYPIKKTKWSCKYLGWHNGDNPSKHFENEPSRACCSKCGAEVGSRNGEWF